MEIFQTFGIDPILIIAQIVNFLVIFYLLRRYLYRPVFDVLKKRQDAIKQGLEQAEKSKQTLEKAATEEKTILKNAHTQAGKIVDDAKSQAHDMLQDAQQKAKKQTEIMLNEAKSQIVSETKESERKLVERISILAGEIVKEATKGLITDKEQDEIVKQALKKIASKKV